MTLLQCYNCLRHCFNTTTVMTLPQCYNCYDIAAMLQLLWHCRNATTVMTLPQCYNCYDIAAMLQLFTTLLQSYNSFDVNNSAELSQDLVIGQIVCCSHKDTVNQNVWWFILICLLWLELYMAWSLNKSTAFLLLLETFFCLETKLKIDFWIVEI